MCTKVRLDSTVLGTIVLMESLLLLVTSLFVKVIRAPTPNGPVC